jgi:hypothetical protein
MSRRVVDLHEIFNKGREIEQTLQQAVQDAIDCRLDELEFIPGKGSGQLKKRVIRFLERPEIRKLYHRLEKDSKNFGKVRIYFKH